MRLLHFKLTVIVLLALGLFSCSKDEPATASSLVGKWYVSQLPSKGSDEMSGSAYYFEDLETVYYYSMISGAPRWEGKSEQLTGAMAGYYVQSGNGKSYSYEVLDGELFIPDKPSIMTISGNTIREEFGSTYTRL